MPFVVFWNFYIFGCTCTNTKRWSFVIEIIYDFGKNTTLYGTAYRQEPGSEAFFLNS